MKKILCMLLAACMLFALAACGEKPAAAPETKEWTRQGYFTDDSKRMLTVLPSEETGKPGWYVAFLNGEDWVEDAFSGTLPQEGAVLRGTLTSYGSRGDLKATLSEDGEAGLQIALDGGETYRLTPLDTGTASIIVRINVDGWGSTDYVVGEEAPPKPEYRFTSHQINIAEPETYTFCAWPDEGCVFVKWTRDGADFSTEPQITVLLDESAEYVAVFEKGPDFDMANPWAVISEEEAGGYCPDLFKAPVGAMGETWLKNEALGDPENGVSPMIQLSFELDGQYYTARAQQGAAEDDDISGIFTEWTVGPVESKLANWGGGDMPGKAWRAVNDTGYIDLITWYDAEACVKYSLSVAGEDLAGFDLQAVAEQMAP